MDETYYQALAFCQRSTREEGIDAALNYKGIKLSGLLVPPDIGQTYQIAAQAGEHPLSYKASASRADLGAGYPMITLPAGINSATGMPFGLAIMTTAFDEASLVKWASAIEDLQFISGTKQRRSLPKWYGYLQRPIPVLNL